MISIPYKLFLNKDEPLVVWGEAFLILDSILCVIYCVWSLYFFYHLSVRGQPPRWRTRRRVWCLLEVENLVWWDPFLVQNLFLHVLDLHHNCKHIINHRTTKKKTKILNNVYYLTGWNKIQYLKNKKKTLDWYFNNRSKKTLTTFFLAFEKLKNIFKKWMNFR